jgi:hypothetical protein
MHPKRVFAWMESIISAIGLSGGRWAMDYCRSLVSISMKPFYVTLRYLVKCLQEQSLIA